MSTSRRSAARGVDSSMMQRSGWMLAGLAIAAVAGAGVWLWRGDSEMDRELDRALEREGGAESALQRGASSAQRSMAERSELEDPVLRTEFRGEVDAYVAGLSGPESAAERAHDRAMAVDAMGKLLDAKLASDAVSADRLAIAARLEAWFASEVDGSVRDAMIEAVAPQRSAITARVLWSGLGDADAGVRDTARFHVADILSETPAPDNEARRLLVERLKGAAADEAAPLRAVARELLEDLDGGGE